MFELGYPIPVDQSPDTVMSLNQHTGDIGDDGL